MKLIEKGFKAGTGRLKTLLEDVVTSNPNDYTYIISGEPIAKRIDKMIKNNKNRFSEKGKTKAFCDVKNIESMIESIILSTEGIPEEVGINFFIYNNGERIDFNNFRNLENVTFYHYAQLNMESLQNKKVKFISDISVGDEYLLSFDSNIRPPRLCKVKGIEDDSAIVVDKLLTYRVTQGDLDTGFAVLERQ